MNKIIMRRVPSGLSPTDDRNWEKLVGNRIKMGDEVMCEIKVPRNLPFLKKYMTMLHTAFDMQDEFENFEHWRAAVQIAAGHCETIVTEGGKVIYIPKSVSFANCEEATFDKVYQAALTAICKHWIHEDAEQLNMILEYT